MNNDLISREALKREIMDNMYFIREEAIAVIKVGDLLKLIDNAETISDRYDEGFRDGYAQCFNDREERKENFIRFLKGGEEG